MSRVDSRFSAERHPERSLERLAANGRVRIAAPERMKMETIRLNAISKLGWIKQQRKQLQEQDRETPREYIERESHYAWGKRYLPQTKEVDAPPFVGRKISCPRTTLMYANPQRLADVAGRARNPAIGNHA